MKKSLALMLAASLAVAVFAEISAVKAHAAKKAEVKKQTECPVMGGAIDKNYYADYKGYRIYFCCPSCIGEFQKNPEKYMKILKDGGVTPEKAPDGEKVKPCRGCPKKK